MGDPLFVRTSEGMIPTPRAQRILDSLDAAMPLIQQDLQDEAAFDAAQSPATFKLLASEVGERHFLPPLMARLQRAAPNVVVQVRRLSERSYGTALETGAADLVIGRLSQPLSSLKSRRLFSDEFVCMVRRGHPILGQLLTLERHLALTYVVISRHGPRTGAIEGAIIRLRGVRRVAVVTPSFTAAPAIVLATDLAATVPSHLVHLYADHGMVGISLPFTVPPIHVALYWHERLQRDATHHWFRRALVDLFDVA